MTHYETRLPNTVLMFEPFADAARYFPQTSHSRKQKIAVSGVLNAAAIYYAVSCYKANTGPGSLGALAAALVSNIGSYFLLRNPTTKADRICTDLTQVGLMVSWLFCMLVAVKNQG